MFGVSEAQDSLFQSQGWLMYIGNLGRLGRNILGSAKLGI